MSAYGKAIASAVVGLAAVVYVYATGGDVETAGTIAKEWEAAIMGIVNTAFVYFVANKT